MEKGSITVFYTLVFMMVMFLVLTVVEVTRYKVCEVHSQRTLKVGAEALLTEFNRPLYERYRLFFLEDVGEPFEKTIMKYCSDTLSPGENEKMIDMFDGALSGVKILDKKYAGDQGGAEVRAQISRFMKRKLAKDAFDLFLKKKETGLPTKVETKEMEKKMESEKKAAKLDLSMFSLMEWVDGVKVAKGKSLTVAPVFLKSITFGKVKSQYLGVNSGFVWNKVKVKIESIGQFGDNTANWEVKLKNQIGKMIIITKKAIQKGTDMEKKLKEADRSSKELESYFRKMDRFFLTFVPTLQGNLIVLSDAESLLDSYKSKDDLQEDLCRVFKNYDTKTIEFDYEGIEERGGALDPGDNVKKKIKEGMEDLLFPEPKKISVKTVKDADGYRTLYEGEKEVAVEVKDYPWAEFALDQYCMDYFAGFMAEKKEEKRGLEYEREYVVAGKESDKDNLIGVANRIIAARTISNFGVLLLNEKMRNEAYLAALAIVGFSGMEPLIRLTQTGILVSWALAESFVDMAALFQGRYVPVIKSAKEITFTLPELFLVKRSLIQSKAKKFLKTRKGLAMNYAEYLVLLMGLTKQSTKLYRLMDLMQWNMILENHPYFNFGTCVSFLKVQGDYQFKTKFFSMTPIQDIVKRRLYQFSISKTVEAGY